MIRFIAFLNILFCLGYFVSSVSDNQYERILYSQVETKIIYYDSAYKIEKEYLYKNVAKPILQNFVLSLEINENASGEDPKLLLSKQKYFLKVKGNWSEYPLKKLEDICLAFVDVPQIKKKDVSQEHKRKTKINEDINLCEGAFSSGNSFITCYKENLFSLNNLFIYFEISKLYLKGLLYFYNIPIIINASNDVIYLTNNKENDKKEQIADLNLHVCYQSSMEKDVYLGKVIFNAYPLNVEKNLNHYDDIYTKSFFTVHWNYTTFVNGNYLTSYNRLVFRSFEKDRTTGVKCGPFWNYASLGAGPIYEHKKNDKTNFFEHSLQYVFSNITPNDYFIPFFKNDELKTEYNYMLCLYSNENDFEGLEIKNVHFFINKADSIALIFLILFVIILVPVIVFVTVFCIFIKVKFLNSELKKLQLKNKKDEIEERLKNELNLDEYETCPE